jgi:LacI family transcriptional regulator
MPRTGLKALAKSLGLSMTTVSRAINGYSDVSEKTRERVLQAAHELDYRPHSAARRLASGRAEAVGFVIPLGAGAFSNPFYGEFLAGVGARLENDEIDLTVFAAAEGAAEMRIYRRLVDRKRVDGVILALTRRHDERIAFLEEHGVPFVSFGRTETDHPYAWLDIDNEAGFRHVTKHLIAQGHRRVGLINYLTQYNFAHLRLMGYRHALAEHALPFDPALVCEGEMGEPAGQRFTHQLLDLPDPPTAIICASYFAGTGVRLALQARRLELGRDISLIVYEDAPVSAPDPTLSVLRQPIYECGVAAADMLLKLVNREEEAGNLQRLWLPELIPGRSDGPPPRR